MRDRRWYHHYRSFCFGALLLVYLAVLFGVCDLHDLYHASHDVTRILAASIELILVGLLCAGCTRLQRRYGSTWWLLPAALLAGLTGVVYLVQIISMVVSNNFISVLALENTESAPLAPVPLPLLVGGVAALVFWFASFIGGLLAERHAAAVGAVRWSRARYCVALALALLAGVWLLRIQHRNDWLEPGFQQAPLINLVANAYASRAGAAIPAVDGPRAAECFADPGRDPRSRQPFQKAVAYQSPLPFARTRAGTPNVIVVFTEGTSTRLIGAYGGHYPGLTPNIDRLAAQSMRVDNYFNHTAATYRGLIGQLSSGYIYYGGYGKHGWQTGDGKKISGAIRRRTLPMILREHGYQSYFFSPHATHVPFTTMLDTLGFDRVYTYESIGHGLLGGHYNVRTGTDSLDDGSLFRGLVAFLQQRAAGADRKPFFIGLYNIGTHAFINTDAHDITYGTSDNPVLNGLHNYDHALGVFLDYFLASPYARNTILIVTADHATYPDADYRAVAGANLAPYFVDHIPLLIDDPFHHLPTTFDAEGRNSLDLAPTLLQLLGIRNTRNSFLGQSLFEPRGFKLGMAALGLRFYLTTMHGIYNAENVPPSLQPIFACEAHVVREYYQAAATNRLVAPASAAH